MSVMNEKQQEENAYHLREQAERDFRESYKDVKVGDPRLMALWDLADRVDAEHFENLVRTNKEATDHAKLASVVRAGLVKDRIDRRSTEVPGYARAMSEASQQLQVLTRAQVPDPKRSYTYYESSAASYMKNFAVETASKLTR